MKTRCLCLLLAALIAAMSCAAALGEGASKYYRPGEDLVLLDQDGVRVALKGDQSGAVFSDGNVELIVEITNEGSKAVTVRYSGEINGASLFYPGFELNLSDPVPAGSTVEARITNMEPLEGVASLDDIETLRFDFSAYIKKSKPAFTVDSGLIAVQRAGSSDAEDGSGDQAPTRLIYASGAALPLFTMNGIGLNLRGDSVPRDGGSTIALGVEVINDTDEPVRLLFRASIDGIALEEEGAYDLVSLGGLNTDFALPNTTSHGMLYLPIEAAATVRRWADVGALELTFRAQDSSAQPLFDTDTITVSPAPSALPVLPETEVNLPVYESEAVLDCLRSLNEGMSAVSNGEITGEMGHRFAARAEGALLASFASCAPIADAETVMAGLEDLPLCADRLLFDLFDYQLDAGDALTGREPIDLDRLDALMPDGWRALKGFDFGGGTATDGVTTWYWEPVYYEDDHQGIEDDALYLYVRAVIRGSDTAFLDEIDAFCPVLGDYGMEQYIIADVGALARFLTALDRERALGTASLNAETYALLTLDSEGQAVKAIQKRLADRGYLTSSVDGYYGPLTQRAVADFQQDQGLEPTGEADDATQRLLLAEAQERSQLTEWLRRNQ